MDSSDEYPINEIIRHQMFACGDVEYPADECIEFIRSLIISHVKAIVERCSISMARRQSRSPDIVDILVQYKNNPKLLKRMYDYVFMINSKYATKFNENGEKCEEEDDDEEMEAEPSTPTLFLKNSFLAAISSFDENNKLVDCVSDVSKQDPIKMMRNRKIADRTRPMKPEKYKRFADARSFSFVRAKGRAVNAYFSGFRRSIDAPEAFDYNMLYLLNFCAVEMLNVLVDNADKVRRKEMGQQLAEGLVSAPIQLEHYEEAAKPILQKRENSGPSCAKKQKIV